MNQAAKHTFFLLLCILSLWVFVPSFDFDYLYLYDDGPLIIENKAVFSNSWARIEVAFSEFVYGLYHPLTSLSLAYNYDWFDGSARSIHVVNFILHLLNGFLVYLLLQGFLKERSWSLIGSAFFLIHPLHIESVVWLSERKDLLYTLFLLLGFLSYLKWRTNTKAGWYLLTVLLFLASLLSKSAAVVFPVLVLVYLFFWEGKKQLKEYLHLIPLFILSLIFGYVNLIAQAEAGFIRSLTEYNFLERILLLSYSLGYYLLSFVWPFSASPKHFYPSVETALPLKYYFSLLGVLLILGAVLKLWKNHKKILFGLFFFSLAILPVLKILPTGNDLVSDRYTYLPYLGLILMLCLWLQKLSSNKSRKLFLRASLILSILSFSFISKQYVSVWESEEQIWTSVLEDNPNHSIPYTERGRFYIVQSEFERALFDLNKAVEIDDQNSLAWNNRGSAYAGMGRAQEAVENFDVAIEIDPNYAFAYSNRGIELSKMGFPEKAMFDFDKAIELEPQNSGHLNNKGIALAQRGEIQAALTLFKKALELSPRHIDAQLNYNRAMSILSKAETTE